MRRNEDGSWRPHYDMRIAEAYRATMPDKDLELWHLYDAVREYQARDRRFGGLDPMDS